MARSERGGTGNLPAESTSFVGRRRDVADVKRLLSSARLVTLTGVGGVGKTRLALRGAQQVRRAFRGGVWLVELDRLRDETLLAAGGRRLPRPRRTARAGAGAVLAEYLPGRQLLLVLDSCEHLVDAAAQARRRAAAGRGRPARPGHQPGTAGRRRGSHPVGAAAAGAGSAPPGRAGRVAALRRRGPVRRAGGGRGARVRPHRRQPGRRWPTSVTCWTACRWRSNWPPRGCGCWPRSRSATACTTGSPCSPAATAPRRPGSRPCAPASTGATSCAARPSGGCGPGCRSSPADSTSTRPNRSAPTTS